MTFYTDVISRCGTVQNARNPKVANFRQNSNFDPMVQLTCICHADIMFLAFFNSLQIRIYSSAGPCPKNRDPDRTQINKNRDRDQTWKFSGPGQPCLVRQCLQPYKPTGTCLSFGRAIFEKFLKNIFWLNLGGKAIRYRDPWLVDLGIPKLFNKCPNLLSVFDRFSQCRWKNAWHKSRI